MAEKSMDQFLFEYNPRADRTPDMSSKEDSFAQNRSNDTFTSMKSELGTYERMVAILAGQEKFEYNLLDNQKMVRALIDQVKTMIKNKEKIKLENKSVLDRIKELEKTQYRTREESDELNQLQSKTKAFQLQKTLMRFDKKLDELDDILGRIEDGVDITEKTIKRYEAIVGDIEDALFQETYVRKNLGYEKGEASGGMKKPTATDNIPVLFRSDNGKTYYGIVRPPSGIITWEGKEARDAWIQDVDIKNLFSMIENSKKYRKDEIFKLRISKGDFKVLSKELLNDKLFSLKTERHQAKFEYRDSDQVKEAVRNYIFNEVEGGAPREVTDHNVMGDIDGIIKQAKTKTVQPSLDNKGRPKDLTSIINSIEFWRFIRGLF